MRADLKAVIDTDEMLRDKPAKHRQTPPLLADLTDWRFGKMTIWVIALVYAALYIVLIGLPQGVGRGLGAGLRGMWGCVKDKMGELIAKDISDMKALWAWVKR